MYFVAAGLVTIQQHMTDGSPKSGLPVDLVGTLSDGCEPYFAFLALKKLDNHLGGHGLLEFASLRAGADGSDDESMLEWPMPAAPALAGVWELSRYDRSEGSVICVKIL